MEFLKTITFADPFYLLLLIAIPALVFWYIFKNRTIQPTLYISTTTPFLQKKQGIKPYIFHILFGVRMFVLAILIVAFARPQTSSRTQDVSIEGIDIVMALDISGSMLAKDFKPNRLEAAKEVATEFIEGRPTDRIGLVIFSGESFTQCPITTDHSVLKNLFKDIKMGMIEDGTAIGMGLATAVNRLKTSEAKSKVIILLTDGVNNTGAIAPITAAEMAKEFGIRVYTVGVGAKGKALAPVAMMPNGEYYYDYVDVIIDEALLQQISNMTNGKYFRATNNEKLHQIYSEIDKMERSKIDVQEWRKKHEEFLPLLLVAGILLLFEVIVRYTYARSIP